ncbi:hypothetical protein SAMN06269117_11316 [Balnearium lithotrophicum]|uniref:Uncharacterized protein n=2 Tax=Balnearium lithotrophicum TaxID=223788 RepID=A0A521CIY5_9BACT|nr:hypothetical protein SAMN06269117_11316 [Balnearium lithotrophicum]
MDGLGFEYLLLRIFECGMKESILRYLTKEEIAELKKALVDKSSLYGISVNKEGKLTVVLYKGDDPAGLASANTFNNCKRDKISFLKTKTVVAYAIATANSLITNRCNDLRDPEDYRLMDKYLEDVFNAKDCDTLFKTLVDYKSNFLGRFKDCFCPEY